MEARKKRTLTGQVVSTKMDKTIAVTIERVVKHPTYGKFIRRTTKLGTTARRGQGQAVGGIITPCRPMSRHKSWALLEVVEKAKGR